MGHQDAGGCESRSDEVDSAEWNGIFRPALATSHHSIGFELLPSDSQLVGARMSGQGSHRVSQGPSGR